MGDFVGKKGKPTWGPYRSTDPATFPVRQRKTDHDPGALEWWARKLCIGLGFSPERYTVCIQGAGRILDHLAKTGAKVIPRPTEGDEFLKVEQDFWDAQTLTPRDET